MVLGGGCRRRFDATLRAERYTLKQAALEGLRKSKMDKERQDLESLQALNKPLRNKPMHPKPSP
jgi:hypothetical protein